MSIGTDRIVDSFIEKLKARGVSIWAEDNSPLLREIEAKLPGRFPASFGSLLARYSFEEFDLGGIRWFAPFACSPVTIQT